MPLLDAVKSLGEHKRKGASDQEDIKMRVEGNANVRMLAGDIQASAPNRISHGCEED